MYPGGAYPSAMPGAYPQPGMYPAAPAFDPLKTVGNGLLGVLGLGATGAAIWALLNALGILNPGAGPAGGGGGNWDFVRRVTLVSQMTQECIGINGAEASGTMLTVRGCDINNPDPAMEWFITGNGRIVHRDANNGWFCMDLPNGDHRPGQPMQVYGCDWPGVAPQQYYEVNGGSIQLADGSMCVSIDAASYNCDPNNDEQRWFPNDLPFLLGSELPTPSALTSSDAAPRQSGSADAEILPSSLRGLGSPADLFSTAGKLLGSAGSQLQVVSI